MVGVVLAVVVFWLANKARPTAQDVARDEGYRRGAEAVDRQWREWYAVNYPEEPEPEGVAGSA